MRLAIADPPYPPATAGRPRPRASRWYGTDAQTQTLGRGCYPADSNPDAAEWDVPARHQLLLEELHATYDGWAIATTPDGIPAYGMLPTACRVMVWVKPNAMPSPSRIHNKWEAVIVLPPVGRRTSRGGIGAVPDVLVAPKPNSGFAGAKPLAWTRWVLDALSFAPDSDEVIDVFPGSGAVASAVAQGVLL